MGFVPADPQFESRTRASFAKQGAMAFGREQREARVAARGVADGGHDPGAAAGLQTLIAVAGRSGVKD